MAVSDASSCDRALAASSFVVSIVRPLVVYLQRLFSAIDTLRWTYRVG